MRTSPPPPPTARRARAAPAAAALAALAALTLTAAAGCAGSQKPSTFVWPLPPEKPRVRFIRAFSGPAEFDTSGWARFRRAITGTASATTLFNPTTLTLSPDDRRLYVACSGKGYVLEFDRTSGSVRHFPFQDGYEPKVPYGLAVDTDGSVYVADSLGKQVMVYSAEGKFLRRVGSGRMERPVGITIDRKRRLVYVVDGGARKSNRHLVEVFAPDGRHLRTIGTVGNHPGEFLFPTNVAVAPNGNLYVSDTLNSRIQVFDTDGTLVTTFGFLGDVPGGMGKVKGIAFDTFGNLHAVDAQNVYVQMFNARHQPLMAYGGPGKIAELMALPNGIAIDAKNHIFVADFGSNQVKEYELFNTTAADSVADGGSAPSHPSEGRTPAQR
jgi:DNA-binding beta-propeller fold protein YncE